MSGKNVKNKQSKAAPASKSESVDLALVRQLADILNATGLTEIELERGQARVRVSKTAFAATSTHTHATPTATHHQPVLQPALPSSPASPADSAGNLKSPMVGTAYLASAPGAPPFVNIGDTVKAGQTVLIIEAMKTMNQIHAHTNGKVVEILVENGQPVEFGEVLLVIA